MKNVKPLDEVDSPVLFSEHEDVFLFNNANQGLDMSNSVLI